jgi:parallel beta-helix repeat protein
MYAAARALAICLLIAGMVPLTPLLSTPAAALDWDGDQTISDVQAYSGDLIILTGNLTITGSLTFTGVDLTLACPSNGSYTIEVRSGGTFNVLAGSRIHSQNPAYRFCFIVRSGATFAMDQSTLEDCGYAGGTQERRGLSLQSSGAAVSDSTLTNNCNGVLVAGQSSPSITGNNISGNDQSGVWVDTGCAPVIDRNTISGNQRKVGTAGSASAGVYGLGCSPVVSNNTISLNLDLSNRAYGTGVRLGTSAAAGSPVISQNVISGHNDSSGWGVYVDNCDALVLGNTVNGNANGCFIGKGASRVDQNRIEFNLRLDNPPAGYAVRDGGHSTYSQNTIKGSVNGVWLADNSLSLFADCLIGNNGESGISGDATTAAFSTTFMNCTFGSNGADVLFDSTVSPSQGGIAFLVNCSFDQALVVISDTDAYVRVSWNMRVRVTVETGGAPAPGAKVKVFDKKGAEQNTYLADADGYIPWMVLEQKTQSYRDNVTKTPYNVTGDKGGLANWTLVNLDSSRTVPVILDDTWPTLSVDDPGNGTVVNRTYANITMTASAGASVYVNNVAAKHQGQGVWKAQVNLTREGPNDFRIRANDGGRNEAWQNVTLVRDITAPVIVIVSPIDRLLTNQTPLRFQGNVSEISGATTINGAPIEVAPDGSFSADVPLYEGDNTVLIECRDAVWNSAALLRTVTLDTAAPELVVTDPDPLDITTNTSAFVIRGFTELNATLTMNGQFLRVNDTEWNAVVGLAEGENIFVFSARDRAGNNRTATVRIVRDTLPPPLVIVYPKDGAVTNMSSVEIRGVAEAGAIVKVNGVLAVLTGAEYKAVIKLDRQGRNTVRVEAWDTFNNRAELTIYINLDTVAPELRLTSPQNNFLTNGKSVEIRGRTEVGAQLTINDRPVLPDGMGIFSSSMGLADEGPNYFEIRSRDAAGNVAFLLLTVNRDTEMIHAVTTPRDGTSVKTATVLVIGSTEANATVRVNDKVVTLRPDKTFISEVALAKGKNVITVLFTDKSGNTAVVTLNITRKVDDPPAKGFLPGFTTAAAVAAAASAIVAAGALRRKKGEREA